ncbi:hypothetical protein PVL29_008630 [Vitis rotundifolia]|uniref:UspA domain-containing protein n=1 Tax=Vitis rotundifolia TaxID=103349 RepID=A0AA39DTL9_VITRO|nr:hypothetical protein PVL29_008630 [Vitis rotundifolia]
MATAEKPVMVVGIDDSEHSLYAFEWTLDHFFAPFPGTAPFKLVIVHAKPSPATAIGLGGLAGPGAIDVLPFVEADLKKTADRVVEKAHEICSSKSVTAIYQLDCNNRKKKIFISLNRYSFSIDLCIYV